MTPRIKTPENLSRYKKKKLRRSELLRLTGIAFPLGVPDLGPTHASVVDRAGAPTAQRTDAKVGTAADDASPAVASTKPARTVGQKA